MADRDLKSIFVVPPISVLDVKQKYWKDRRKYWNSTGIMGASGRENNLLSMSKLMQKKHNATSIFDPVLTECMYTWFTKENDIICDPFAGGAVRGIVASKLKRNYFGVDIRQEQIDDNYTQANTICNSHLPSWGLGDASTYTYSENYDFVFTCPPYYNLEKYSNDKHDLSNMSKTDFELAFTTSIQNAVNSLNNNRFAAIVIGDVRTNGIYNNFYSLAVNAFASAGADFYNDMVLLQEPATAAMRAFTFMNSSRKIAKCHQNVLVFVKGDPILATNRMPKFTSESKDTPFDNLFDF